MRKKMVAAGALTMLALIGCVHGIWGFFSDSVSVQNQISIGDVNISLSEKELEHGREIPYQDPKTVFPGDLVSKIPMVTNLAEPCWIRVHVAYESDRKEQEGFDDACLLGISGDWVHRGDFYYYTKILKQTEAVDFFHYVLVPPEWTQEHEDQKLSIDIRADAIQAQNVEPDFASENPWGDTPVELCVHETDGQETQRREQVIHIIEFNGKAHRLISVTPDFFSNFGTAMPGDVLRDQAKLANTTRRSAELFFRTESINADGISGELLQRLILTINMNGERIYRGSLRGETLAKDFSLVKLKPDEEGTLDFSVEIPAELTNIYALSKTQVKWIFTVREDEEENPAKNTEKSTENSDGKRTDSVRTGDETNAIGWCFLLMAATIVGGFGISLKKGGHRR